jgi:hypothetical protein
MMDDMFAALNRSAGATFVSTSNDSGVVPAKAGYTCTGMWMMITVHQFDTGLPFWHSQLDYRLISHGWK